MISKTAVGILLLSFFVGSLAECSGEGGALRCPAGKTLKVVEEEAEGSNLDQESGNCVQFEGPLIPIDLDLYTIAQTC